MVCSTSETGGMKKEHEPHEWKEGRRKLSLGTIATRVQAERVSCGLGMSRDTASLLLNRAKAEGIVGLRRAPASGSQRKLSAEQLAQLRRCWRKEQQRLGTEGMYGRPGASASDCGRSDCGISVGYYGGVSLGLVALFRSLCSHQEEDH